MAEYAGGFGAGFAPGLAQTGNALALIPLIRQRREEEDEHGQRHDLRRRQECERCEALPEPDRAAVGRCEHQAVENAVLVLRDPRSAKWKTTSVESTNRSMAGKVSRPRSSIRRSLRVSAATSAR